MRYKTNSIKAPRNILWCDLRPLLALQRVQWLLTKSGSEKDKLGRTRAPVQVRALQAAKGAR